MESAPPHEERWNALSHGLGAVLSLVGASVLVTLAAQRGDGGRLIAALVFGIALVVAGPMLEVLPAATLAWLLAGGLAYSAGTVFYLSRRAFAHAVWHAFVLAGSTCHYVAVTQHLLGA